MKLCDIGYARWDGKFNDLRTRLCFIPIYLDRKNWRFAIELHPPWQYPFGLLKGQSVGWYLFEIKLLWIRLVWHYRFFRPEEKRYPR